MSEIMPTIVCYHANCLDGLTAAWAAFQKFGSMAEYRPVNYDQVPDIKDFKDREVVFVDFCWSRETMTRIADAAKSLTVLDHHATAKDNLTDFPGEAKVVFDMTRSGARIAWDELVGGPVPKIVKAVEDRDLWRFQYPDTKAINAYLFTYILRADTGGPVETLAGAMTRTALTLDSEEGLSRIVKAGEIIKAGEDAVIKDLTQSGGFTAMLGDHLVRACNTSVYFSDIAGELAKTHGIGVAYFQRKMNGKLGWQYSLRSTPDGPDVAKIAKEYGGGGHPHAAGINTEKFLLEIFDR